MTGFSSPGESALVAACRRARRRRRHLAALLSTLRQSLVYLKHASDGDDGLIFVSRGRVLTSWLCVYSSLDELRADVGWPDWRVMPGSVLLDLVLPEYGGQRGPTGIVLDNASDHRMLLPPIPPVVTAEAAVRMAWAGARR